MRPPRRDRRLASGRRVRRRDRRRPGSRDRLGDPPDDAARCARLPRFVERLELRTWCGGDRGQHRRAAHLDRGRRGRRRRGRGRSGSTSIPRPAGRPASRRLPRRLRAERRRGAGRGTKLTTLPASPDRAPSEREWTFRGRRHRRRRARQQRRLLAGARGPVSAGRRRDGAELEAEYRGGIGAGPGAASPRSGGRRLGARRRGRACGNPLRRAGLPAETAPRKQQRGGGSRPSPPRLLASLWLYPGWSAPGRLLVLSVGNTHGPDASNGDKVASSSFRRSPVVAGSSRRRSSAQRMIRETCICETPMRSPISLWVRSSTKLRCRTSRSLSVSSFEPLLEHDVVLDLVEVLVAARRPARRAGSRPPRRAGPRPARRARRGARRGSPRAPRGPRTPPCWWRPRPPRHRACGPSRSPGRRPRSGSAAAPPSGRGGRAWPRSGRGSGGAARRGSSGVA